MLTRLFKLKGLCLAPFRLQKLTLCMEEEFVEKEGREEKDGEEGVCQGDTCHHVLRQGLLRKPLGRAHVASPGMDIIL